MLIPAMLVIILGLLCLLSLCAYLLRSAQALFSSMDQKIFRESMRSLGVNAINTSLFGGFGTVIAAMSAKIGAILILVIVTWSLVIALGGYACILIASQKEKE